MQKVSTIFFLLFCGLIISIGLHFVKSTTIPNAKEAILSQIDQEALSTDDKKQKPIRLKKSKAKKEQNTENQEVYTQQETTEQQYSDGYSYEQLELFDLRKVEDLLNNGHSYDALKIITNYIKEIENIGPYAKQWFHYFVYAANEIGDVAQLVILYEFAPQEFTNKESASLKVADAYISQGRIEEFNTIRATWIRRETEHSGWLVLDADKLMLQKRNQEALELLKSQTFYGKADVGRLIRLSLLHFQTQPEVAWDYLEKAVAKDPQNPQIRKYRAMVLEFLGHYKSAFDEYTIAAKLNPNVKENSQQLADFCIKYGRYDEALKIWESLLKETPSEDLWAKTYFWNMVVHPTDTNWKRIKLPIGKLQPLIYYFMSLKPGEFWNDEKFYRLHYSKEYLMTRQETFWLNLIASLRNHDEDTAWEMLRINPFYGQSWNPPLEQALKQILLYRKIILNPASVNNDDIQDMFIQRHTLIPPHDFFKKLNYAFSNSFRHVPLEVKYLLESDTVFSAAFLASGWTEAGLELQQHQQLPFHRGFPDWVAHAITMGMKKNRDNEEAIRFAEQQQETPLLNLLIGEILLEEKEYEDALRKLTPLVGLGSDIGFKASLLVSNIHLANKDYASAKKIIKAEPRLAQNVLGKEILARIFFLEGEVQKAHSLYSSIENRSSEAKSFLARKAFEEHNWERARILTEKLLEENPDNLVLRENLKKIDAYLATP